MTTPSTFPPTDNLYKFCALLGSIMVILAFYYPIKNIIAINEKMDACDLMLDKSEVNVKFLNGKADILKEIVKNGIAEQMGKFKQDSTKFNIEYTEDEIKKLNNEIFDIQKESRMSLAEASHYSNQAKHLITYGIIMILATLVFSIVGLFLAVWGYSNWYYKIQIYQDKEIKDRVDPGKVEEKK
jgi:hypothetical protein